MSQSDGGFIISMDHYTKSVECQKSVPREKDNELSKNERTEYRASVGHLNWVAHGARPDKAFDGVELSSN